MNIDFKDGRNIENPLMLVEAIADAEKSCEVASLSDSEEDEDEIVD